MNAEEFWTLVYLSAVAILVVWGAVHLHKHPSPRDPNDPTDNHW